MFSVLREEKGNLNIVLVCGYTLTLNLNCFIPNAETYMHVNYGKSAHSVTPSQQEVDKTVSMFGGNRNTPLIKSLRFGAQWQSKVHGI